MARPKQTQIETKPQLVAKRKLSLGEFRAWLSGVEEMQPEDWTPNASQWRTIRSKIEEVIDVRQQPRFDDGGYDDRPPAPIRHAGPSAFGGNPAPMAPPSTALTIEQNLVSVPNQEPSAGGTHSGGLKVKTPNIDTSKTAYVAAFE